MSLGFHISAASDVPIFRQLVRQIQRAVAVGQIAIGEQLPAVRVLAETLIVNPNTVARAYQELIREGVLESRSGRGVFVTERRQIYSDAERERRLRESAGQLCHEALMLGADLNETRSILETTWKGLRNEARNNSSTERKRK